jgi:hypothetical protein
MSASVCAWLEVEDEEDELEEVLRRAIGSSMVFSISVVGDAGNRVGLASLSALAMKRSVGSMVS